MRFRSDGVSTLLALLCPALLAVGMPVVSTPPTQASEEPPKPQVEHISQLPWETVEKITGMLDPPSLAALRGTSPSFRRHVDAHVRDRFQAMVNRRWGAANHHKWYHAASMLCECHTRVPIQQFRWLIQDVGASTLTPLQINRLAVKCGRMGWLEAVQVLWETGHVSQEAWVLMLDDSAFRIASEHLHSTVMLGEVQRDVGIETDCTGEQLVGGNLLVDVPMDVTGLTSSTDPSTRFTLLPLAAYFGASSVVRALLQDGAIDLDRKTKFPTMAASIVLSAVPPIFGAANAQVARLLMEAGANVNARAEGGLTPLMAAAVIALDEEAVVGLLQAGADKSLQDDQGRTALDYAQELDRVLAEEGGSHLLEHRLVLRELLK